MLMLTQISIIFNLIKNYDRIFYSHHFKIKCRKPICNRGLGVLKGKKMFYIYTKTCKFNYYSVKEPVRVYLISCGCMFRYSTYSTVCQPIYIVTHFVVVNENREIT